MVLWALENAWGGEIMVPKIPSYRITDVAKAIAPECKQIVVGVRPGQKIHEEMITESDSFNTVKMESNYAILTLGETYSLTDYCSKNGAKQVLPGFHYNSGTNKHFLTVEELCDLIRTHIDPNHRV